MTKQEMKERMEILFRAGLRLTPKKTLELYEAWFGWMSNADSGVFEKAINIWVGKYDIFPPPYKLAEYMNDIVSPGVVTINPDEFKKKE